MAVGKPLEGQVAIVTGGASGIGRATALTLGAAGAKVVVNYLREADEAEQVVDQIRNAGSDGIAVQADVSDEDDVRRLFDETIERFGTVDILVNNAGIQKDAEFLDMSLEDWQAVLAVNLTGPFLCTRAAVREFLRRGPRDEVSKATGKVINMSSVHERIPWAGRVNYAVSKAGMSMLTQTLAQELAHKRIRINSVAPGAIRTPINEETWSDEENKRELLELIPYGRIGDPEEVGKLVVWLASDEADYITGETIFMDGGMTLYPSFRGGQAMNQ
jgi:glucose 1-dehydrogenase